MRRLKIKCDMDGILAACIQHWFGVLKARHGLSTSIAEMMSLTTTFDIAKHPHLAHLAHDEIFDPMYEIGFFENFAPISGAVKSLTQLASDGHSIEILTATSSARGSGFDTMAQWGKLWWIRQWLPWLSPTAVKFASTATKSIGNADVLIDDHPETLRRNAIEAPGKLICGILYPYNRDVEDKHGIKLANDYLNTSAAWVQIVKWISKHADIGDAYHE